jgi:phage baseplate assembly protein W
MIAMMNRSTGRWLTPLEHLRQSITVILSTPIGSRLMRRDFGSMLPYLVDRPVAMRFRTDLYYATARALKRWEPRVKVKRVAMRLLSDTKVRIDLWLDVVLKSGRRVPFTVDFELPRGGA